MLVEEMLIAACAESPVQEHLVATQSLAGLVVVVEMPN
jgi:hypothetical protein